MLFQKFLPCGLSLPLRRWLNPVSPEDGGNPSVTHIVTQMGERALGAPITPAEVLSRDAHNQGLNLLRRQRSAGSPLLAPVVRSLRMTMQG
jgi:hypothetical protein